MHTLHPRAATARPPGPGRGRRTGRTLILALCVLALTISGAIANVASASAAAKKGCGAPANKNCFQIAGQSGKRLGLTSTGSVALGTNVMAGTTDWALVKTDFAGSYQLKNLSTKTCLTQDKPKSLTPCDATGNAEKYIAFSTTDIDYAGNYKFRVRQTAQLSEQCLTETYASAASTQALLPQLTACQQNNIHQDWKLVGDDVTNFAKQIVLDSAIQRCKLTGADGTALNCGLRNTTETKSVVSNCLGAVAKPGATSITPPKDVKSDAGAWAFFQGDASRVQGYPTPFAKGAASWATTGLSTKQLWTFAKKYRVVQSSWVSTYGDGPATGWTFAASTNYTWISMLTTVRETHGTLAVDTNDPTITSYVVVDFTLPSTDGGSSYKVNQSPKPPKASDCTQPQALDSATPVNGLVYNEPHDSSIDSENFYQGMSFKTGTTNLTVTALGRYFVDGNNQTHDVGLFQVDPTNVHPTVQVAGVDIDTSTATVTAGGFQYVNLPVPVTLLPNTTYLLGSTEGQGNDGYPASMSVSFNDPGFSSAMSRGYHADNGSFDNGGAGLSTGGVSLLHVIDKTSKQ